MWTRVGDILSQQTFEPVLAEYDPPYESPIEDVFAWNLVKCLDPATALIKQLSAATICGRFRLDFACTAKGRSIGFECDGADYHDDLRDECRDAMILWSGHADVIYRLRGADLHYRMNEVMGTLVELEPSLFSERGHRIAMCLSRNAVSRYTGAGMVLVEYAAEEGERRSFPLHVERRTRDLRFLRDFAEFAWERGGGEIDDVISAFLGQRAAGVA